MSIEIIDTIDVDKILKEYQDLEPKLEWLEDHNTKQCCLQYAENRHSLIEGCGTPHIDEMLYSTCNNLILDSIFEKIIKKYNLYRTRFMWVRSRRCYSLHRDFSQRIHIPLITNPSAMFVFKDTGIHHLEIGNVYKIDTTKVHSFANFGNHDRLHIIGCI